MKCDASLVSYLSKRQRCEQFKERTALLQGAYIAYATKTKRKRNDEMRRKPSILSVKTAEMRAVQGEARELTSSK